MSDKPDNGGAARALPSNLYELGGELFRSLGAAAPAIAVVGGLLGALYMFNEQYQKGRAESDQRYATRLEEERKRLDGMQKSIMAQLSELSERQIKSVKSLFELQELTRQQIEAEKLRSQERIRAAKLKSDEELKKERQAFEARRIEQGKKLEELQRAADAEIQAKREEIRKQERAYAERQRQIDEKQRALNTSVGELTTLREQMITMARGLLASGAEEGDPGYEEALRAKERYFPHESFDPIVAALAELAGFPDAAARQSIREKLIGRQPAELEQAIRDTTGYESWWKLIATDENGVERTEGFVGLGRHPDGADGPDVVLVIEVSQAPIEDGGERAKSDSVQIMRDVRVVRAPDPQDWNRELAFVVFLPDDGSDGFISLAEDLRVDGGWRFSELLELDLSPNQRVASIPVRGAPAPREYPMIDTDTLSRNAPGLYRAALADEWEPFADGVEAQRRAPGFSADDSLAEVDLAGVPGDLIESWKTLLAAAVKRDPDTVKSVLGTNVSVEQAGRIAALALHRDFAVTGIEPAPSLDAPPAIQATRALPSLRFVMNARYRTSVHKPEQAYVRFEFSERRAGPGRAGGWQLAGFENISPEVASVVQRQRAAPGVELALAQDAERDGFRALLDGDFTRARVAFDAAEQAYPGYHQVYEIARALDPDAADLGSAEGQRAVLLRIVQEMAWKAPPELLGELRSQLGLQP